MPKPKKEKATEDYASMTIEQLEEKMSDREILFAELYEINSDTEEAALQAGYKPNKSRSAYATGSRLLKQPRTAAYMKLRRQETFERLDLNRETLAFGALRIYYRAMRGIPNLAWNPDKKAYEADGTVKTDGRGALCALKVLCGLLGIPGERTADYETIEEFLERNADGAAPDDMTQTGGE